jgi:hypothetical protein
MNRLRGSGTVRGAVGCGVPVELLVEAVMWPQRQIKEGYVATTVVMKDGRTLVDFNIQNECLPRLPYPHYRLPYYHNIFTGWKR